MAVVAYKWGGISFDDYSLIKTLILPSDADTVEKTFHDGGANYQVPSGKVFIVGRVMWGCNSSANMRRVGESVAADGPLSPVVFQLSPPLASNLWQYEEVIGVFTAGKYVTGDSVAGGNDLQSGTTLYGVEIDA